MGVAGTLAFAFQSAADGPTTQAKDDSSTRYDDVPDTPDGADSGSGSQRDDASSDNGNTPNATPTGLTPSASAKPKVVNLGHANDDRASRTDSRSHVLVPQSHPSGTGSSSTAPSQGADSPSAPPSQSETPPATSPGDDHGKGGGGVLTGVVNGVGDTVGGVVSGVGGLLGG